MFNMTLEEVKFQQEKELTRLIDFAGNAAHLAAMLDIGVGTVRGWVERKRISKKGASLVEKHPTLKLEFTKLGLRPELAIGKKITEK